MLNLVALLPEIQQQGTADMEFAVVGLLARTQVCADYDASAVYFRCARTF